MPNFGVLDARIASALNRIIRNSHLERRVSLEEQWRPKISPFPSRKTDRLPDLRVLSGHWSQWYCREVCRPIYYCSAKWWHEEFDSKWDGILLSMTKIPSDDILERLVQIRNTRVWEIRYRVGIVQYGGSPEEVSTWLSQIEDDGKKKYRARITNQEFWGHNTEIMKGTRWSRIRGQNSMDRTLGDCWQWKTNGQCSEGDNCIVRHDINKRANMTQPNPCPSFFHAAEREKCVEIPKS